MVQIHSPRFFDNLDATSLPRAVRQRKWQISAPHLKRVLTRPRHTHHFADRHQHEVRPFSDR